MAPAAADGDSHAGNARPGAEVEEATGEARSDCGGEQHRLHSSTVVTGSGLHGQHPPAEKRVLGCDGRCSGLGHVATILLGRSSAPMPAFSSRVRASSRRSSGTSTRRARIPSDPSMTLMFWSTTSEFDPRFLEQGIGEGDQHQVVCPQELFHEKVRFVRQDSRLNVGCRAVAHNRTVAGCA